MTNDASTYTAPLPRGSLKRRTARGAAWTTGQLAVSSFLRLCSNLLLVRLVAPEAFGLIGVVVMVQFLTEMISDIGIKSSVIRSDNADDPEFLSTAWVLKMARGILVATIVSGFAALCWAAGTFGWVPETSIYADPRTPTFIMFGAAAAIIRSTFSINYALAERHFLMSRVSITAIAAQLIATMTTLSIAFITNDPIALAFGLLANPIVITVASHIFFPGPPFSVVVRRKYIDEMLTYGIWLLVASIFSFFAQKGAQLLFGFYLDKTQFSFLALALTFIGIARQGLKTIQRRVALPAFSELRRKRPEAQTDAYYRMRMLADGFAVAVYLGTLFVAGTILDFLFPESYDQVIHYIQLMCITILFVPFELLDTVLLSDGSSRQFSITKIAIAAAVLVGIPIVYTVFGAEAAILYSGITPAAAVPFTLLFGKKTISLNPLREAVLPLIAIVGFTYVLLR